VSFFANISAKYYQHRFRIKQLEIVAAKRRGWNFFKHSVYSLFLAAWPVVSIVRRRPPMNEVTLRRVHLVLKWVTVCGRYAIWVCNQPTIYRSAQPCIPPGSLNRVPACCGKGRNISSAGWQVTLCDPIAYRTWVLVAVWLVANPDIALLLNTTLHYNCAIVSYFLLRVSIQ